MVPSRGTVVVGIDLMQSAHDLGTAPRLVNTQVADEVRRLHAAVSTVTREQRSHHR